MLDMASRTGRCIRRRGIAALGVTVVAIVAVAASAPAGAVRSPAAIKHDVATNASGNFLLRGGAFTPLPDSPGAEETVHNRINNRGETVGITAVSAPTPAFHGFVQRNGIFRRIDVRGASDTVPLGINDRGQIAGVYVDPGGAIHSFVRERDGDITKIEVPGALTTAIYDINNRGHVVGDFIDAEQVQHGFVWARGKVTTIDPPGVKAAPGGPGSRAIGLNDRGDVVGSYFDGRVFHAFVRTRRGYTDIDPVDPVPGLGAEASGINNRGEVVGRYTVLADSATAKLRGFRWRKGSVTTIPDAPGDRCDTVAFDINERGQIVVPAPGSLKPGCPIPLDPGP
jgi:probable HAF family extracellular repeat protein